MLSSPAPFSGILREKLSVRPWNKDADSILWWSADRLPTQIFVTLFLLGLPVYRNTSLRRMLKHGSSEERLSEVPRPHFRCKWAPVASLMVRISQAALKTVHTHLCQMPSWHLRCVLWTQRLCRSLLTSILEGRGEQERWEVLNFGVPSI